MYLYVFMVFAQMLSSQLAVSFRKFLHIKLLEKTVPSCESIGYSSNRLLIKTHFKTLASLCPPNLNYITNLAQFQSVSLLEKPILNHFNPDPHVSGNYLFLSLYLHICPFNLHKDFELRGVIFSFFRFLG